MTGLLVGTECRGKLWVLLNCVHGGSLKICYEESIRISLIDHAVDVVLLRSFILSSQCWFSFGMVVCCGCIFCHQHCIVIDFGPLNLLSSQILKERCPKNPNGFMDFRHRQSACLFTV